MALKDLVVSGREADLMKENNRLREALRLAKRDLLSAMRHIEAELVYIPPVSNGERQSDQG
jgi:hypothetical protein